MKVEHKELIDMLITVLEKHPE